MTKMLMLQLPDELQHKLTVKAELLNLSVEDLALSSLSDSVGATTLEEILHKANRLVVVEIFNRLRAAKQEGQERVDVPATDLSYQLVEVMKQSGQIVDFQVSETHPQTQLTLLLLPSSPDAIAQSNHAVHSAPSGDLSPEIEQILQSMSSPNASDPDVARDRLQMLRDLAASYREQS